MKARLKQRWQKYITTKSKWNIASDIVFVLFLIALLIPASRKEVAAVISRLFAPSPKLMQEAQQTQIPEDTWNWQFYTIDYQSAQFKDFKNKPIFLNFWATWCPPCIAEMPDIQKLYDQFGDKIAFVLLTDEAPEKVAAFMHKKGFDMPVYLHQSAVPSVFATNSIPTTWIIDPTGNIIIRKTGAAKWNSSSMQHTMQQLISKK